MKRGRLFKSLTITMDKAFQKAMDKAQEFNIDRVLARSIWEAWRTVDHDMTGMLDSVEAHKLLEKLLGYSLQEGEAALFQKYDQDGDHALDFGEFICLLQDISRENGTSIGSVLLKSHLIDDRPAESAKLPKTQVVRFLQIEIEQMDACKQLVPTVVLFVAFLLSFIFHESPYVIHTQQKGIHFDLNENANFAFGGAYPYDTGRMGHKTLYDVNTFADFWSWMDIGLSPLIFHNSWDVSEVRATIGVKDCSSRSALLEEWGLSDSSATESALPNYCGELPPLPQTESEQGMYLFLSSGSWWSSFVTRTRGCV